MTERNPSLPPKEPPTGADKRAPSGNGKQAQTDEAKDEGAGKLSVPVDELTTENDDGAG